MAKILVLHGPNLNLLGSREQQFYGATSLNQINDRITRIAAEAGHELVAKQSNAEHELVEWVHAAVGEGISFIVINPAAYTHTSVALRDAMLAVDIPFVEVHLSNIYHREEFRHHSYFSDIAEGVISGLGGEGYEFGIRAAITHIENSE